MASDDILSLGSGIDAGNAISLMLSCESEGEIKACFEALSAGGTVHQALGKQFWGATYGELSDRFGLRWMLNWEPAKA
jgi:PhnB protein